MIPTWNRGFGALALAVAGGAGALGTNAASASVDSRQIAQPVAAVERPATVDLGSIQSVRVERRPLHKHVAKVKTRPRTPRQVGRTLAAARGWGAAQFACLDSLWTNESNWSSHAENRSGAYGIPQALPGRKMAAAGSNWRTSARTQIRWGLRYIAQRHGTPCSAWAYWRSHHWY
jgi:hypothetical protein